MKKIILLLLFTSLISTLYATTRIMPLGDSITYDDSYADNENPRPASLRHAYRNYLWYKLRDGGYSVDFVGPRVAGTEITPYFDPENAGYPGETTDYIGNHIYDFLANNHTDIILLHIGTNDRLRIDDSGNHMSGMTKIFNEIDRYENNYNQHVKVFMALIINRRYNDHESFTNTFNTNIKNLANNRIANGDDIHIVDMQHGAGIDYTNDFQDPAHPNDTGYSKMGNKWYYEIRNFLVIKPNPPTNLYISSLTEESTTLKWSDNSNNESGFKIYKNSTYIATVGANTLLYNLNNLIPNTTYTYNVAAYNSYGASSTTAVTFKTLPAPIPEIPTSVISSEIDKYSATLKWEDNSKYEKGFKIYQGSILIATVPANSTSYKLSDLNSREEYTYKIAAYNDAGLSNTVSVTFTTKDDYVWLPAVYHAILY